MSTNNMSTVQQLELQIARLQKSVADLNDKNQVLAEKLNEEILSPKDPGSDLITSTKAEMFKKTQTIVRDDATPNKLVHDTIEKLRSSNDQWTSHHQESHQACQFSSPKAQVAELELKGLVCKLEMQLQNLLMLNTTLDGTEQGITEQAYLPRVKKSIIQATNNIQKSLLQFNACAEELLASLNAEWTQHHQQNHDGCSFTGIADHNDATIA